MNFSFSESELTNLGWDGGLIRFSLGTQSGTPGSPGEGIPDETVIYEIDPTRL